MAEIKSTLDLVLERTRHLTLSEEERKAAEREEQLKKVPGYVQRFLDGVWSINHLKTELDQFPPELREEMIRGLEERFLEELDLEEKGKRCLEGLKLLAQKEEQTRIDQIRSTILSFEKSGKEELPALEEKMKADLLAEGIGGDAVVVHPQDSPQWQEKKQGFRDQLREVQSAWKTRLKQAENR